MLLKAKQKIKYKEHENKLGRIIKHQFLIKMNLNENKLNHTVMMNKIITIGLFCSLFLIGCGDKNSELDEEIDTNIYYSDSFLPMNIGNYWKIDNSNYISITDTISIEGELFYKFWSLSGGDVMSTQYLRINENNELIESSPTDPGWKFLHAKFNSEVGSKFFTLNDKTVNDFEVTTVSNKNNIISFEFKLIYHSVLKGEKHTVSYKKGLGFVEKWKEVNINNAIYHFE